MKPGILLIDKPEGWTSHDVVAKLRGVLRERRVGHGGTLDPMATGLLPILVGRATRAMDYLPSVKTYAATVRFGLETDTQDITGEVTHRWDILPDTAAVLAAARKFCGELQQIPPMVSAVKVGGQRLYKLAREGKSVERAPRVIHVYQLEMQPLSESDYRLTVTCSTGTYIRTLAHDIGQAAGCGATLTSLRRTVIGAWRVEDAVDWETLLADADPGRFCLSIDTVFEAYPSVRLDIGAEMRYRQGVGVAVGAEFPSGLCRVYGGTFLGLGRCELRGQAVFVHPHCNFFEPKQ